MSSLLLRHAVRRLAFAVPTLAVVSLLCFALLSLVPTSSAGLARELADPSPFTAELEARARERFEHLPRFVNTAPDDARTRANSALAQLAFGDARAQARGAAELARLGGAALPHVLPALDGLAPLPRARVALALAPVARRMGLEGDATGENATKAIAFWSRFWRDRAVEFRESAMRGAVRRLVRYGSAGRARELTELDTFALEALFAELPWPEDRASVARARLLVDVIAHVTESEDRIAPDDNVAKAQACVARWRRFWGAYGGDFGTLTGSERVTAVFLETRYGKWIEDAVANDLGLTTRGRPVAEVLAERAPATLALVFGGLALAYLVAVPFGVATALGRGTRVDLALTSALAGLYALPVAAWASLLAAFGPPGARGSVAAGALVLACALVAAPARKLRSAFAAELARDYVTAARARGASARRAALVHALRASAVPAITVAATEVPFALGAAFVIERALRVPGLCDATLEAAGTSDTSFLMALALCVSVTANLFLLATDVGYALLDPRMRGVVARRRAAA